VPDTAYRNTRCGGSSGGCGRVTSVERLSGEIELLKKIVKQVKGIELMVEFEREATVRL